MHDFTRRTATGADASDMPYPLHELDRKQLQEQLRVERLLTVDESMVHLVVLDERNRIRGALALPADALTMDDPQWLIERVKRAMRPDLKIAR